MQLFAIINNKLKENKSKLNNVTIYVHPIYFLETTDPKNLQLTTRNFINYILDATANHTKLYKKPPDIYHYFVFKHPNIIEPEEEYAKESAKSFGLSLINFKRGWAIKIVSKFKGFKFQSYEHDIKKLSYKTFANPLLNIFIQYEYFDTKKITKPIRHSIQLPNIDNFEHLQNFYNFTNEELQIIFESYKKKFGRKPNIIEIGTFAQYWSEHCRHKTINSTYFVDGKLTFTNLLKETIFEVTSKLNRKWCISVFKDNSGVIDVDGKFCVCAKVETHNHPSSIEPYSGSATGVGGVIRDIIGTGKGAKPIGSIDIFFVGDISNSNPKIQNLVWNPHNLLKNLVCGVRDYGNRIGIPTVSGSVYFDDSYLFNPLVYCGTIGLIDKNKVEKDVSPGNLIILIGGKTGRDGLHGASFSSGKISEEEFNSTILSVQLPNPIVEKKVEQFIIRATKENIIKSITDCGAGGISVASLEIIQDFGAEIKLDDVKIKYKGLSPYELWLSEAQERMVIVIDKNHLNRFIEIADEEDVDFSVLGIITKSPICKIYFKNKVIAKFHKDTLDRKIPSREFHLNSFSITKPEPIHPHLTRNPQSAINKLKSEILNIISNPIIASKENIIRRYDHEVGGRTVIKPIIDNISPANGSALKLLYNKNIAVVVGIGHKVELMKVDTYQGCMQSIDEAVRNIITLGANPDKIALLDNFCWGDSNNHDELYKLVESARACKDLGLIYKTPFISGKDSFNNFFVDSNGKKINITPTLLITAIGIVENISYIPSTILKGDNSNIYFIGSDQFLLGGSIFYKQHGYTGKFYPKLEPSYAIKLHKLIHIAIRRRIISSIHDVSDGGMITTIIEMFLDSSYGVELNLDSSNLQYSIFNLLFSEPPSSFIVEIRNDKVKEFEKLFKNFFYFKAGRTINNHRLVIKTNYKHIKLSKNTLKKHYLQPLSDLF